MLGYVFDLYEKVSGRLGYILLRTGGEGKISNGPTGIIRSQRLPN
jgi:hypothetical protein